MFASTWARFSSAVRLRRCIETVTFPSSSRPRGVPGIPTCTFWRRMSICPWWSTSAATNPSTIAGTASFAASFAMGAPGRHSSPGLYRFGRPWASCRGRTGGPVARPDRDGAGSAHQPGAPELRRDLLHGEVDVRRLPGPGADELPGAEQEDHDPGLFHPAHEARELLGLVLDPVEAEGDGDGVEVDLRLEVGARDDVLDLDLGVGLDPLAALADLLGDDGDGVLHLLHALPAGADDLAGPEEEDRGLRLLQPVDDARELIGLVLGAFQMERDRLEIELVREGEGRHHILDPDFWHRPTTPSGT